jgi:hypothetical protein
MPLANAGQFIRSTHGQGPRRLVLLMAAKAGVAHQPLYTPISDWMEQEMKAHLLALPASESRLVL